MKIFEGWYNGEFFSFVYYSKTQLKYELTKFQNYVDFCPSEVV